MAVDEQTPDLPDQRLILRAICDPGKFTPRGDYQGEPFGETVQRWSMRAVQMVIAEWLAGGTVLEPSTEEQWCYFYGGPDPDNSAGSRVTEDEADARESVEWVIALGGKGIARRQVSCGPWEVVDFTSDRLASESSGDGENDAE